MRKYHYLLSLLFVFCIPTLGAGFLLSDRISFQALTPFIVLVTLIGSIWDVWATRHGKKDRTWLWQFNNSQTIGVRFLGLPIEEYFFYVASSVYVIFMWEGFNLMLQSSDTEVYTTIGLLSVWTLVSIGVPYIVGRRKGDKFIS